MSRTRWPRALWIVGAALLVAMVFHVVALAVTGGPLTGPVSLRKPATFAETGWLVAWSVALLMPVLRMRAWQEHVIGFATTLFAVGETTIMAIEAWRGVPSHYNFATPFDAVLMRGFAAGTAGVFLIATVVLLVAALRARLSPDVRIGIVGGVAVLLLGCAIGFGMISNNSGVYQGSFGSGFGNRGSAYLGPAPATIGQDYLLIRPETQGGDLVLPHAIGVHGLVLLAVPAVLLAGTVLDARRRLVVVASLVGAVVVAEAVLVVHALRELPLDQLSPLALVALAICAGVLLAGYAITAAALLAARRVPSRTTLL
jgi:hypothetical protein